ncbi:hypothetical protein ACFE33_13205 [Falsihalocynthiibacter sp. SS001]|uniref:hypothetical protein n=1 Tax=Falsihalocynthiibacter sp. SS001 TaxID=3349698 RepID=UPI0036D3A4C4
MGLVSSICPPSIPKSLTTNRNIKLNSEVMAIKLIGSRYRADGVNWKKGVFLASMVGVVSFALSGCRYLCYKSDDEFIENALEHLVKFHNSEGNMRFYGTYLYNSKATDYSPFEGDYLAASSVEEFLEVNEGCCSFSYRGGEGWVPKFSARLATDFEGFVTIKYQLRKNSGAEIVGPIISAEVAMNSCAEIIPYNEIRPGRFD